MKRVKLSKKGKPNVITKDDSDQIEALYKIKPSYINGCYLTPVLHEKSSMVRITFSEFNHTLLKSVPVSAVVASIEDVQTIYNALTQLLQNMREMGRIQ